MIALLLKSSSMFPLRAEIFLVFRAFHFFFNCHLKAHVGSSAVCNKLFIAQLENFFLHTLPFPLRALTASNFKVTDCFPLPELRRALSAHMKFEKTKTFHLPLPSRARTSDVAKRFPLASIEDVAAVPAIVDVVAVVDVAVAAVDMIEALAIKSSDEDDEETGNDLA